MKIGIDARLLHETGVGRYIRNLIEHLSNIDTTNEYILFLGKEAYEQFSVPNVRWQKRLLSVRWHTLAEQVILPYMFWKEQLDLVHIPYFTVPIFYPGKMISTIHDLTILHVSTGKASTLPYPLYLLRRLGYKIILFAGVYRASHIIAVSESTKKEVITFLRVPEKKITVTYEGIDEIFLGVSEAAPILEQPYFLYVGNVYPHKQADLLYKAFKTAMRDDEQFRNDNVRLVFVGKKDFFYERLIQRVHEDTNNSSVIFIHNADDTSLKNLYAHAIALVFPSKMEGFGLPPLEALSQNCPVLVSDIPVFHELLESHAVFIPSDIEKWKQQLRGIYQKRKKEPFKKANYSDILSRYSWKKMAEKTLSIYETCNRI